MTLSRQEEEPLRAALDGQRKNAQVQATAQRPRSRKRMSLVIGVVDDETAPLKSNRPLNEEVLLVAEGRLEERTTPQMNTATETEIGKTRERRTKGNVRGARPSLAVAKMRSEATMGVTPSRSLRKDRTIGTKQARVTQKQLLPPSNSHHSSRNNLPRPSRSKRREVPRNNIPKVARKATHPPAKVMAAIATMAGKVNVEAPVAVDPATTKGIGAVETAAKMTGSGVKVPETVLLVTTLTPVKTRDTLSSRRRTRNHCTSRGGTSEFKIPVIFDQVGEPTHAKEMGALLTQTSLKLLKSQK